MIFYFLGAACLIGIDQLTKWLVLEYVKPVRTIPLWEDIFHLTYCENRGAAFGMLQNWFGFFYMMTIIVVLAVTIYMVTRRPESGFVTFSFTLLVGGALGNFMDRLFRGFVVDFLDFRLIHFPIFNMADCFVVCGAILLAAYVILKNDKPDKTVQKFKMI